MISRAEYHGGSPQVIRIVHKVLISYTMLQSNLRIDVEELFSLFCIHLAEIKYIFVKLWDCYVELWDLRFFWDIL